MKTKTSHNILVPVIFFIILLLGLSIFLYNQLQNDPKSQLNNPASDTTEIISGEFDKNRFRSDYEWRKILTEKQYHILRGRGTETPFTGELNDEKRKGTYYSVGCDAPLFRSEQKYDSGTGWPSFWAPISENALVLRIESAPGDNRIEVLDTCGSHLGHVFNDGPQPTGKRYCMNSEALRFVPDEGQKTK